MNTIIDHDARFFIGFVETPCIIIPVLPASLVFLLLFSTKISVLCTIFQATAWRNLQIGSS